MKAIRALRAYVPIASPALSQSRTILRSNPDKPVPAGADKPSHTGGVYVVSAHRSTARHVQDIRARHSPDPSFYVLPSAARNSGPFASSAIPAALLTLRIPLLVFAQSFQVAFRMRLPNI